MADRAGKAAENLNGIENQLRSFREFIPSYVRRLDSEVASRISALLPEIEELLASIADEKGKLALLSARFMRPTLNIGVTGRAGQGKSTFLQMLTGLTTDEIPSGDKGHCTGAPSMIVNHDLDETFADIAFHTPDSFLEGVIQPFFQRLKMGAAPDTLDQFFSTSIPQTPSADSTDRTTDEEHLKKLRFFQENLPHYRILLKGGKRRVTRDEIRSYVAQEDPDGERKLSNWVAVQMATLYCKFPNQNVGDVAVGDTPGLGDFLSGAEERLVATVGRNLDVAIFLRRPPADRAVIDPQDTALHGLISRAIPDLPVEDWSYFVINKDPVNAKNLALFERELKKSAVRTRRACPVDCSNEAEVANCLDQILDDVSANLPTLDERLATRQSVRLRVLASAIEAFSEKAAKALPKVAVVAPDLALLDRLFGAVWKRIGSALSNAVGDKRVTRDDPDPDFVGAVETIFKTLEEGPGLPSPDEISKEAAAGGLQLWHAHRLHEIRIKFSNSFDQLNSCLDSSFDRLRDDLLRALTAEDGGMLARLSSPSKKDKWQDLIDRWAGHEDGEIMNRAIETLRSARLSYRGFILPRIRLCLDVLDSDAEAAKDFAYLPGDSTKELRDKLETAWSNACFNCKAAIEEMSREPSTARFAVAEEFMDAVLRTGGEDHAREVWKRFYHENRSDIWPDQFQKLEADTRLRKEWENAVRMLKDTANSLSTTV